MSFAIVNFAEKKDFLLHNDYSADEKEFYNCIMEGNIITKAEIICFEDIDEQQKPFTVIFEKNFYFILMKLIY